MQRLSFMSGMQWIRDGFAVLRRQPNELSLLFLLYVTVTVLFNVVPGVGAILFLLFNQVLTMAFMEGCARVAAGGHAEPRLLFSYFRSRAFGRLTALGLGYIVAFFAASLAMYLYVGGDMAEAIVRANNGEVAVDAATRDALLSALFLGSAVFLLMVFPLWFAAPLIAWQDMSLGKALFFSFFSVGRAIKAFVAYFLSWAVISMFVMINLIALISLLHITSYALYMALLIPAFIFLTMLRYCSYYPSYVEMFGKPQLADDTPPSA